MFALVVRFPLRPGAGPAFDELIARTLQAIRVSEPGTLTYVSHAVEGDKDARIFFELYRDRYAFDEHERQPAVREFLLQREQYLAGPPRVEFLTPLDGKGLPE